MTRQRTFFAAILLIALVLAGVVSYYASSSPDGLEKVAADKGFSGAERQHDLSDSPVAGYGVKGVQDARLSGGLAGVLGVGATLALGSGVFLVLRRRGTRPGTDPAARPAPSASTGD
jgi:hypothetical protein